MCLITKQLKPEIAEKDIIVYKVGYTRISYKFFNLIKVYQFHPYYYSSYIYRKNKKAPKIELNPIPGITKTTFTINEGYHAWLTRVDAYRRLGCGVIGRFKISKGSKYYLGTNGDIVANQIIYLGVEKLILLIELYV